MSAGIHGTGRQAQAGDDPGGFVGRDTSRDQGGDQAAWRDLVARLELPSAIDPAHAPWPDRENLAPTAPQAPFAQATPDGHGTPAGPGTRAGPGSPAAQQVPTHEASDVAAAGDAPDGPGPEAGNDASANRSRIIRPASFLHFADPVDGPPAPGSADAAGRWRDRLPWPDGDDEPEAPPDLGFFDDDGQDDLYEDEGYVPPYVPPQPKLDPVARGAWTALFGGPGYLFIATTLGWQVPGWAELAAIVAFVAGFVILVSRLGDGPSRRDGPDQGAVV